ncbi:MAG: 30S ribosomal protein S14 [Gammaproteobacteria bacterium]
MASNRMIRREKKRVKGQRLSGKRQALRAQINDPALSLEDKLHALKMIEQLPRDSSSVRLSRRCRLTGRVHGVYRKFGLGRNELRRRAQIGEVPGLVMASW